MSNFPDALLQLMIGILHIFWSGSDAEVVNIEVILFIFILNITDKVLPRGTPSSWLWGLEKIDPTRTQNFLSERKLFMKLGNLPRSPFIIPNLQVVS